MCSLNYYKGFSVVRTMSVLETYDIIHSYANKLAASPAPYGHYQGVGASPPPYCGALKVKQVKCENITPQNIGEIMLCNIPSVSTKTAAVIMKKYGTLGALMDALKGSTDCLDDIRLETQRKLSKQCIQNIYNFLMG
jgi:ERCC4-type nuclease